MFERTIITKLNDYIYLLDDAHQATGYLVLGQERAALIDTMNGLEDLRAVVRSITDLPIVVINTHGHPDHIFGNIFFGEAFMNPRDNEIAAQFLSNPQLQEKIAKEGLFTPTFRPTRSGDVFDLGGVKLEVIDLPGHTPGGILLLNRADGTLFTGDSINWHTWMQLDSCLPMHEFLENLDRLAPVLSGVKRILHGHAQDFDSPELLIHHREAVRELVQGNTEGDQPYTYFGSPAMVHSYKVAPMQIVYDPDKPM